MENNRFSLAVQAYSWQNLDIPSIDNPHATPRNTAFPGHDVFQNGIIPENQPTTFYTAATDQDIENIRNRKSYFSGFLTDQGTVNSCKVDGVLDANKFAESTQTKPWRPTDAPDGADFSYRNNVVAFDVNWTELNKPDNKDIKDRLCNPDGLSPFSNDIKCAFGKAEANDHWGSGGGNQYYISQDTFNEAVNRGVFQYNENKSFRECKGTLYRHGVPESQMNEMDDVRREKIRASLQSCRDKNAIFDVDKAKSLNEITPDKTVLINSSQASDGKYIAKPDPVYTSSLNSSQTTTYHGNDITQEKVSSGGGARAPNENYNNFNRDIDVFSDLGLSNASVSSYSSRSNSLSNSGGLQ